MDIDKIAERFWSKVDKRGECWVWTAAKTKTGYGKFKFASYDMQPAHRVAWFLAHGTAARLNVCHRCDNRLCVRPDHLFEGDDLANMSDAAKKGRLPGWNRAKTHCIRGHPLSGDNLRITSSSRSRTGLMRVCRECTRERGRVLDKKRSHERYLAVKADPVRYARMLERGRRYDKQRYQERLESGHFREARRRSQQD